MEKLNYKLLRKTIEKYGNENLILELTCDTDSNLIDINLITGDLEVDENLLAIEWNDENASVATMLHEDIVDEYELGSRVHL